MGGGPTGVEVAAEIHDLIAEDIYGFFPSLKASKASAFLPLLMDAFVWCCRCVLNPCIKGKHEFGSCLPDILEALSTDTAQRFKIVDRQPLGLALTRPVWCLLFTCTTAAMWLLWSSNVADAY